MADSRWLWSPPGVRAGPACGCGWGRGVRLSGRAELRKYKHRQESQLPACRRVDAVGPIHRQGSDRLRFVRYWSDSQRPFEPAVQAQHLRASQHFAGRSVGPPDGDIERRARAYVRHTEMDGIRGGVRLGRQPGFRAVKGVSDPRPDSRLDDQPGQEDRNQQQDG